jgi:hypothetical protein
VKFLPEAGPDRRRAIILIAVLIVIAVLYWKYGPYSGSDAPMQTTGPQPASNTAVQPGQPPRTTPGRAARNDSQTPQPLRLAEMEQVPDEPRAGRNLFRFGEPPPPPVQPYVAPPVVEYRPPPPAPPPPPQVPLKLNTVIVDPADPSRKRAYLQLPDGTIFEAVQGQTLDGRYKVWEVHDFSVVVSFVDGTGRRTLQIGR